jgi:type VI secretion system protein ImpG
MNFNRYYQDEIAYIRELGAEFAKRNPDLAPYLSTESKDPDVERLIESFAFLTGRLREQIDDGLPEFVHALLAVLWPQALQPIPCTTTIQFDPVKGSITGTETIPRGVQVLSKVVEGVRCSFRTTSDLRLHPYAVSMAEIEEVAGLGILRIKIAPVGEVTPEEVDFGPLRFFLNFHNDIIAGAELRLLLRHNVRAIRIIRRDGSSLALPGARFTAAGFTRNDALLQTTETSFDALRILQEFLSVPEKFAFLDLEGLPPAVGYAGDEFTIAVEFDQPFKTLTRLNAGQLRLNCVSAINLFEADAEPITISRQLTEYRLATTDPRHVDIFEIIRVVGWTRGHAERIAYDRFEAFHRRPRSGNPSYYVRLKPSVTRRQYDHYIAFGEMEGAASTGKADLALARLTCCNGTLPELLGMGEIADPGQNAPLSAKPRNVSPVTGYVVPPLNAMGLWSIVSIMARNYYPIAHVEGLRNLLEHLNFRAFIDRQAGRRQELMTQGLQSVSTEPCDMVIRGHPVRGRHITLTINEDDMEGLGRAYLFGEVMDRFLGLFANLNTCHRFSLHCSRSNTIFDWPMRMGTVSPL